MIKKRRKIVKYKSILKLSEKHQFLKIAAPFKAQVRYLKIEGHKWILHKNDPDVFFPSCPHFDCCDQKWKLDIYSGKIYHSSNHSYVKTIPDKVLEEKIWGNDTIVNMINDIRKRYELERKNKPDRFPQLPSISNNVSSTKLKLTHCNRESNICTILPNGDIVIIL